MATATIASDQSWCKHIFIKSTNPTTTFDVKLTDRYNLDIYTITDVTGELSDPIDLPTYGNWTLTISNASIDESFDYLFTYITML